MKRGLHHTLYNLGITVRALEDYDAAIRDTDYLFRWGGEEFIVLLPHTSEDDAAIAAVRLRRQVSGEPVSRGGQEIQGTRPGGDRGAGYPSTSTGAGTRSGCRRRAVGAPGQVLVAGLAPVEPSRKNTDDEGEDEAPEKGRPPGHRAGSATHRRRTPAVAPPPSRRPSYPFEGCATREPELRTRHR